ncbi:MAG: hypothetical protein AWU57_516 [Marinobacter sp. T13-3]|nr:MAG: hypothetical protein AWU57_516 [Marinobacter sp. T13-3]
MALVELMLALAVIAVVLGTIAKIAGSQSAEQKALAEARTAKAAVNELRVIFQRQETFEALDLSTTIDIDLWPERNVTGPNTLANTWGGSITLAPDPAWPNNEVINIQWTEVAGDSCPTLATFPFGAERVSVNGNQVFNSGYMGVPTDLDMGAIGANCQGNDNTVTVWFAKDIR